MTRWRRRVDVGVRLAVPLGAPDDLCGAVGLDEVGVGGPGLTVRSGGGLTRPAGERVVCGIRSACLGGEDFGGVQGFPGVFDLTLHIMGNAGAAE